MTEDKSVIEDAEGTITSGTHEIKTLKDGIAALGQAVADETKQCKAENQDYNRTYGTGHSRQGVA